MIVYDILRVIFMLSREEAIPTSEAANRLAEARIDAIARIKLTYAGRSGFTGRLGERTRGGR